MHGNVSKLNKAAVSLANNKRINILHIDNR